MAMYIKLRFVLRRAPIAARRYLKRCDFAQRNQNCRNTFEVVERISSYVPSSFFFKKKQPGW